MSQTAEQNFATSTRVRGVLTAAKGKPIAELLAAMRDPDLLDLPQDLIAQACHVTTRTVRQWESGGTPRPHHATAVRELAGTAAVLLGTLTPAGVRQWFFAPNPELNDRTPAEKLWLFPVKVRTAAKAFVDGGYR